MESRTTRRRQAGRREAAPVETIRVAQVSAEVTPFSKVGGLADVAAALPGALGAAGVETCVIAPRYTRVEPAGLDVRRHDACPRVVVPGPWENREAEIWQATLPGSDVTVYLVGCPAYFERAGVYADPATGEGYPDNAERYAFFSRAAFEFLKTLPVPPDVVHIHDNHPAPLALLLRGPGATPGPLARCGLVTTIHNLAFQGVYPAKEAIRLGAPREALEWGGCLEFYGNANYLKAAVLLSDRVTTVSERYAEEIKSDPTFGYGLEGVLSARGSDVVGILNGVDYRVWEPSADAHISAHYDRNRLAGKAECRKLLCESMGLPAPVRRGRAILGMVSRLADQKGFDLLAEIAPELVTRNVQLAILGTGELRYHRFLEDLARTHPASVAVHFGFSEELAHRITAGSDLYLMPSRYEPCGLNQIYSLRYGTIPVVHATGGLADTVADADERPREGTGFVFTEYTGEAFLAALDRALGAYSDARRWRTIMRRAMEADFGWERSAGSYRRVYDAARKEARELRSAGRPLSEVEA